MENKPIFSMLILTAGLYLWLIPAPVTAQSDTRLPQSLFWVRYYLQWQIDQRWILHGEVDNRCFFEPKGGQNQFISHLHIHRTAGNYWEVWAGISYSAIAAQNPLAEPAAVSTEIRPWQAVSLRHATRRFTLTQRLRWEERYFGLFRQSDVRFSFRARYALILQYPLGKNWALKTGDEIMLHWGKGIHQAFDQNRIWAGMEFSFAQKRGSIEALYLWLWQKSPGGNTTYDRDVLRLTVTQRI